MFDPLFRIGNFALPAFFTLVTIAILVATFYMYFQAPGKGLSQVVVLDMGMVGAVTGILGARLFHVFVEAFWYYQQDPWHFFEFWRGGFVSYGAFIGGVIGVLAYLKIRKLSLMRYADLAASSLPFLVFFIRVGCLGAGCCFGKPTTSPFHVIFHSPYSPAALVGLQDLPLHPTQIYDMINAIIIFGILRWRYRKPAFDGEILLLFFILYGFGRSIVEIFRADLDRGVYFGGAISTAQIVGGSIAFACLIIEVVVLRRAKPRVVSA